MHSEEVLYSPLKNAVYSPFPFLVTTSPVSPSNTTSVGMDRTPYFFHNVSLICIFHRLLYETDIHGMVERYPSYSDWTESSDMKMTSISPMASSPSCADCKYVLWASYASARRGVNARHGGHQWALWEGWWAKVCMKKEVKKHHYENSPEVEHHVLLSTESIRRRYLLPIAVE